MAPKDGKLNQRQAKRMLPMVKKFNAIGEVFVKILQKRVETKRKKVQQIRVMVTGMKKPLPAPGHQYVSVTTKKFNPKFWQKKKDEPEETTSSIDLPWKNTDYGKGNRGVML